MTASIPWLWRSDHGLVEPLTAFNPRRLETVTVAWRTRDGGVQTTVEWWRDGGRDE